MDRKQTILEELASARESLVQLARGLSEEDLARPTENEGWTVRDTLAHTVSSEAGLRATVQRILGGQKTATPGFDLAAHNAKQIEKRKAMTVEDLLAKMVTSREETWRLLEQISPEQLGERGCLSSGREATVEEVLTRIAHHEEEHGAQISRAVGR